MKNSLKLSSKKVLMVLAALLLLTLFSTGAIALESIDYTGLHNDKYVAENGQATLSGRSIYLNYGIDLSAFIPVFEGFEYLNLGLKIKVDDIISPSNLKASSSISIGDEIADITNNPRHSSSSAPSLSSGGSYLAKLNGSLKLLDSTDPYNYSDQDLSIDFLAGMNLNSKPLIVSLATVWRPSDLFVFSTGVKGEAMEGDAGLLEMSPSLYSAAAICLDGINIGYSYKMDADNSKHTISVSVSPDIFIGIAKTTNPVSYASL